MQKVNSRVIKDEHHKKVAEALKAYIERKLNKRPTQKSSKQAIDNLIDLYGNEYLEKTGKPEKAIKIGTRECSTAIKPKFAEAGIRVKSETLTDPKLNFLIEALIKEGCYDEPTPYAEFENSLFHCMIEKMYKGEYSLPSILPGTYLLYRKTFNKYEEDGVTIIKLWIYEDAKEKLNHKSILRYKTHCHYDSDNADNLNESVLRIRKSEGHCFAFQDNILLFGSVEYKHLHSSDGSVEQDQNNYPEILTLNISGDKQKYSGLMIGNFPFTGLPVSTSIYLKKQKDQKYDLKTLMDDLEVGSFKLSDPTITPEIEKYVTNKIEELYSGMLAPR